VKLCVTTDVPIINDRTKVSQECLKDLKQFAESHGLDFDRRILAGVLLPQDPVSLKACAWMAYYFGLMGDNVPNSNGKWGKLCV
jgi:hypothetical protein